MTTTTSTTAAAASSNVDGGTPSSLSSSLTTTMIKTTIASPRQSSVAGRRICQSAVWTIGWRLVIVAKSLRSMLRKEQLLYLCSSCPVPMPSLVELRPKTRCMNTDFLVSHPAVVSSLVLKLGTPSRIPPVADGGVKSVSEKYTAVVEIVMHVLK